MLKKLKELPRNEQIYWLGLLMLFAGLACYSLGLALAVTGGSMALVELVTAYLNAWLERK